MNAYAACTFSRTPRPTPDRWTTESALACAISIHPAHFTSVTRASASLTSLYPTALPAISLPVLCYSSESICLSAVAELPVCMSSLPQCLLQCILLCAMATLHRASSTSACLALNLRAWLIACCVQPAWGRAPACPPLCDVLEAKCML